MTAIYTTGTIIINPNFTPPLIAPAPIDPSDPNLYHFPADPASAAQAHKELPFKELPMSAQQPLQLSRILAKYKTPLPNEVCRMEVYGCLPHDYSHDHVKVYHTDRHHSSNGKRSAIGAVETEAGLRLTLLGSSNNSSSRKSEHRVLTFVDNNGGSSSISSSAMVY